VTRPSDASHTKAIEQLGSDKAPVRLGRLVHTRRARSGKPCAPPDHVNVICTYLRMPFSLTAPASKPEPEAAGDQKEPGTENATETDEISSPWQQERHVRLTAQRILGEHLRDDTAKDQQSTDPLGSHLWHNIHLDFSGATLIDFDLVDGITADANFHRAAFSRDASFRGAPFNGDAGIGEAAFSGNAQFGGAAFRGDAWFGKATFSGGVWFEEAVFSGDGDALISSKRESCHPALHMSGHRDGASQTPMAVDTRSSVRTTAAAVLERPGRRAPLKRWRWPSSQAQRLRRRPAPAADRRAVIGVTLST
jgi:hypothetical protein